MRGLVIITALLVLGTGACAADDAAAPNRASSPASSTPAPSTAPTTAPSSESTSPTPAPEPDPLATPIASRCGASFPRGATVREAPLRGGRGDLLRGALFPTRAKAPVTALVLLHQTDGDGLCGWGPFAAAAARAGYPSVAFDLCGYGGSTCSDRLEASPADQVDLAADYARRRLGVSRVIVVGASMGGSNAVVAAVDGARVDAWVDVSGPDDWFPDRPLHDLAPQLRRSAPGMVVIAHSEGSTDFATARELADSSGAEFVGASYGHGFELLTGDDGTLTRVGRRVLAFTGP